MLRFCVCTCAKRFGFVSPRAQNALVPTLCVLKTFRVRVSTCAKRLNFVSLRVRNVSVSCLHVRKTFQFRVATCAKRFGFGCVTVQAVSVSCLYACKTFRFRDTTCAKRLGFVFPRALNFLVSCRYVQRFRFRICTCADRFGFVPLRVRNVSVSCVYACETFQFLVSTSAVFLFRVSRTFQEGQRNPLTAVFNRNAFQSGFLQLNRVFLALTESNWAHQFGEPGFFCASKLTDLIPVSTYDKCSGSTKMTTDLGQISHCKTASGTTGSNRWTYRVFMIYTPRDKLLASPHLTSHRKPIQ